MSRITRTLLVFSLATMVSACGIFGGGGQNKNLGPVTTALGVNGFLWQATLDTLAFMPIDNASPQSAAIITDWYSTPDSADERVKVAVYFRSERLRSDGIKVNVVRQQRQNDAWVSVPVQASTALQIEEAILTQARILRVEADN